MQRITYLLHSQLSVWPINYAGVRLVIIILIFTSVQLRALNTYKMQSPHDGVPNQPSLQEAFGPIREAEESTLEGSEGGQEFPSGVWFCTNRPTIILKLILIKQTFIDYYVPGIKRL